MPKPIAFTAPATLMSLALLSAPASATLKREPGEANITIQGWMSPAGSFNGGCVDEQCSGLEVTEANDTITISIPFSRVQVGSGIVFGIRTTDMRKMFGENNRVSLAVPKSSLKLPEDGRTLTASATGMLSIKQGGKAVSKKFSYKVTRSGNTYSVNKGSLDIDLLEDFGIDTKKQIRKFSVYVKPHVAIRDVSFTVAER